MPGDGLHRRQGNPGAGPQFSQDLLAPPAWTRTAAT